MNFRNNPEGDERADIKTFQKKQLRQMKMNTPPVGTPLSCELPPPNVRVQGFFPNFYFDKFQVQGENVKE